MGKSENRLRYSRMLQLTKFHIGGSRDGLVGVTGAWRPNKSDLELLESRLADISVVQSQSASKDTHIGQPSLYYRQYIAVLVGRRKLIYVNGFLDKPPSSWRKRVVNICDTGPTDWGVVYDPANTHFFDLRTNVGLPVPPPPP